MANKGVTGGPLRSLKWGGINITPSMDGEPEIELGDRDFETKKGGNGDIYADGTSIVQYLQHDIVLSATDYNTLVALKDGNTRSGSATLANGDVLALNCMIDGELKPSNGVATLKLSGTITKL